MLRSSVVMFHEYLPPSKRHDFLHLNPDAFDLPESSVMTFEEALAWPGPAGQTRSRDELLIVLGSTHGVVMGRGLGLDPENVDIREQRYDGLLLLQYAYDIANTFADDPAGLRLSGMHTIYLAARYLELRLSQVDVPGLTSDPLVHAHLRQCIEGVAAAFEIAHFNWSLGNLATD
jgi:hypothetical protein